MAAFAGWGNSGEPSFEKPEIGYPSGLKSLCLKVLQRIQDKVMVARRIK